MIIGLTGKNGAGKGEVANILKEAGFIYHSLSDVIRDEVSKLGKTITRDLLIKIGNKLRETGGPSVLADKILEKLDPEKNYVVDSIRHPAEVQALKRRSDFTLVCVTAPPDTRFERIKARARESDPVNFKSFLELEKKEAENADPTAQQLVSTIKLANLEIENTASIEDLSEKVKNIIRDLSKKAKRPPWDEYFMGIAKVAALRSNCIKRKVAAVIIRDKRIIATGYNGTPRGIKNCNEGGCPRCNSFGSSGKNLEECLCSHAEENSIVQSAYHGVEIRDSTLYTTFSPCLMCTKMIINSGIKEVVYNAAYPMADLPLKLLAEAYIKVRKV